MRPQAQVCDVTIRRWCAFSLPIVQVGGYWSSHILELALLADIKGLVSASLLLIGDHSTEKGITQHPVPSLLHC